MKKLLLLLLAGVSFTGCFLLNNNTIATVGNQSTQNKYLDAANKIKTKDYYAATELDIPVTSDDEGKELFTININVGNTVAKYNKLVKSAEDINSFEFAKLDNDFIYNDEKTIHELNNKVYDLLKNKNAFSRAANYESTYVPEKHKKEYKINDTENFYVLLDKTNGSNYSYKTAVCKAIGKYCYVWYIEDPTLSFIDLKNTKFDQIAEKFDLIYEKETNVFGSNKLPSVQSGFIKIDNVPKQHILIYDLYGDATEKQEGGTLGFFFNGDFITNEEIIKNTNIGNFKSNECEIFYIDSWFLIKYEEMLYSTLSHEFQHMLGFINKYMKNGKNHSVWFTEMLSMCCEELMQVVLGVQDENTPASTRLQYFNLHPNYGFNSYIWDLFRTKPDMSGTYEYANTYAFGTYLMHNYGGAKLIKEIACNNYVDEEAITKALKALNYDETFETVLLKFPQVLLNTKKEESDSKVITLNKDITCTINGYKYDNKALDLFDPVHDIVIKNPENDLYKNIIDHAENISFVIDGNGVMTINGPVYWKDLFDVYPYGMLFNRRARINSEKNYKLDRLPEQNDLFTIIYKK